MIKVKCVGCDFEVSFYCSKCEGSNKNCLNCEDRALKIVPINCGKCLKKLQFESDITKCKILVQIQETEDKLESLKTTLEELVPENIIKKADETTFGNSGKYKSLILFDCGIVAGLLGKTTFTQDDYDYIRNLKNAVEDVKTKYILARMVDNIRHSLKLNNK